MNVPPARAAPKHSADTDSTRNNHVIVTLW
jgi:hypothetical protein